jgi:hypothetical protein
MQELRALIGCGRPWAEQRALMALELADAFSTGQMTADEYKALLEDLIRTDVLDSEADDIEVKNMLVYGVYALTKLV